MARFNRPTSLAVDAGGTVYVADTDNHVVRKISPAGEVTTMAGLAPVTGSADGTGAAASFSSPIGVATDSAGQVYVAEFLNKTIRKITPAGQVTTLAGQTRVTGHADGVGTAATFAQPWGVATDNAGNVYVADSFNSTIRKITPAGVVTTVVGRALVMGFHPGDLPGLIRYPRSAAVSGSTICLSSGVAILIVTDFR